MTEDRSHGSPFDRGESDAYYRRAPVPHRWRAGSLATREALTDPADVAAYWRGYEAEPDRKQWRSPE